jgi:phage terminase Nu1 subunit (DNA packaging protein)
MKEPRVRGRLRTDGGLRMVGEDGSVTIEAAAELMGIDVRVIREWLAIGSLRIERRGDEEVVHLGQVRKLFRSPMASGSAGSRRGALRVLRRDTRADAEGVAWLQELARERTAAGS